MLNWIEVCSAGELDTEEILRFDYENKTYAVFKSPDEKYYCTDGLCSHQHVHLAEGVVDNFTIECSKHNGKFDYRTGEATCRPARKALAIYSTKIENNRIFIKI